MSKTLSGSLTQRRYERKNKINHNYIDTVCSPTLAATPVSSKRVVYLVWTNVRKQLVHVHTQITNSSLDAAGEKWGDGRSLAILYREFESYAQIQSRNFIRA